MTESKLIFSKLQIKGSPLKIWKHKHRNCKVIKVMGCDTTGEKITTAIGLRCNTHGETYLINIKFTKEKLNARQGRTRNRRRNSTAKSNAR